MKSSEHELRERADAAITRMAAHLNEDYLARHIDEPINRAAASFRHYATRHVSRERFHQVVARFVAHLYGHGLPCPVRLSRSQARDEAIALLGECYKVSPADGYTAAWLDASQGHPPGMEVVLERMGDTIKLRARRTHDMWVFSSVLSPAAWELRCEIANRLLERCRPWMPQYLSGCTGAQFADDIPALFMESRSIDDSLQQVYMPNCDAS